MKAKEIAILVVFVVFVLPTLFGIISFSSKMSQDPSNPDNIEEGAQVITDAVVPWWVGPMEALAGLPGIIGAILIIALVVFLKWIGEIK